jgi:hypothetical protein
MGAVGGVMGYISSPYCFCLHKQLLQLLFVGTQTAEDIGIAYCGSV